MISRWVRSSHPWAISNIIPVTETNKCVRTYQEKRRRQLIKKNYVHGRTGEGKKGAA